MVCDNVNNINHTSKKVINLVGITIRASIIVWTRFWAIKVTIIRAMIIIFVVFISISKFTSLYFTLILLCRIRVVFPFKPDRFSTTINRFPTIRDGSGVTKVGFRQLHMMIDTNVPRSIFIFIEASSGSKFLSFHPFSSFSMSSWCIVIHLKFFLFFVDCTQFSERTQQHQQSQAFQSASIAAASVNYLLSTSSSKLEFLSGCVIRSCEGMKTRQNLTNLWS